MNYPSPKFPIIKKYIKKRTKERRSKTGIEYYWDLKEPGVIIKLRIFIPFKGAISALRLLRMEFVGSRHLPLLKLPQIPFLLLTFYAQTCASDSHISNNLHTPFFLFRVDSPPSFFSLKKSFILIKLLTTCKIIIFFGEYL